MQSNSREEVIAALENTSGSSHTKVVENTVELESDRSKLQQAFEKQKINTNFKRGLFLDSKLPAVSCSKH